MYSVTNHSKGRRGVWSRGRLFWLEPGQTRTLTLDNVAQDRLVAGLKIEAVGELPEVPADLAATVAKAAAPKRRTRRTRAS